MNLLLDTHIATWVVENNRRLSEPARKLIAGASPNVFVSVVSLWEIAIKHALNRGPTAMPMSAKQAAGLFEASGLQILPVTLEHVLAVELLAPAHDDPFDRLIVATVQTGRFRLVTHDARLAKYGGKISVV
jgi:PIN domain nuclease of toxin-antitoxin system